MQTRQGAFFMPKNEGRLKMAKEKKSDEIEKLRKEISDLHLQIEQTKRGINRKENKMKKVENKERKQRTHSLCFKAAHLEYLFPKLKNLNDAQFVMFADGLKEVPGVQDYVEQFEIKPIGEVEE